MKSVLSPGRPAIRVLIVEDDEDDQELLTIQLRKTRFLDHVLFINDGQKALDLLTKANQEINPAEILAVFLDLNLPGLGGVEFLKKIRATRKFSTLPVVVMSGSTNPKDAEACRELNVLSFVSKPVPIQTFSMLVANVFDPPVTKEISTARHY